MESEVKHMGQAARKLEWMPEPEKREYIQLVSFVIGKEQFGVDILMVQEIIRMAPITSIPNAPAFIEGVINLRGHIIPVIDLRKRLHLDPLGEEHKENTRILIINIQDRVTGFIVDSVSEVLKIQSNSIEPPPEIVVVGLKSQYIYGVCKLDRGLLILLDFSKILQVEEIKKLMEIQAD
jgi:purine-binding chemotaxis protein CheW